MRPRHGRRTCARESRRLARVSQQAVAMAKKAARRGRPKRGLVTAPSNGGSLRRPSEEVDERKHPKKNKIHVSLFVDGQDVTLIEEFNTPAEAIAACREFLDAHSPSPVSKE